MGKEKKRESVTTEAHTEYSINQITAKTTNKQTHTHKAHNSHSIFSRSVYPNVVVELLLFFLAPVSIWENFQLKIEKFVEQTMDPNGSLMNLQQNSRHNRSVHRFCYACVPLIFGDNMIIIYKLLHFFTL